ncbi:MAG: AraC family transcriptional regulator [Bryobacterales bacterium]|nr:AraC family transcriptional regulator [Bryobacterales bacterium]
MILHRQPRGALAGFVKLLWHGETAPGAAGVEHALPSGAMHVVLRLWGPEVRIYSRRGVMEPGYALVCGARSEYYVKDTGPAFCSIGAVLQPGASLALFSAPGGELAEAHTALEDLWGREAELLRERLAGTADGHVRLRIFEAALLARLKPVPLHAAVAGALQMFAGGSDVAAAVKASGYSHRHFNQLFLSAAGLTPKVHCRVQRFQRILRGMTAGESWADLAMEAGYSDQAHFCREFQRMAGATPTEYARAQPAFPMHLPRSNSFNTDGRR